MSTSETITRTDLANILNEVLPNTSVDYIVEQGTDTGWSYRKYSDKTYDAWRTIDLNIARNTAYGSLYRSAEQWANLPSFNSGADYVLAGSVGQGDWLDTNLVRAADFSYYLVRTTTASAADRTVRFYVHGTWA